MYGPFPRFPNSPGKRNPAGLPSLDALTADMNARGGSPTTPFLPGGLPNAKRHFGTPVAPYGAPGVGGFYGVDPRAPSPVLAPPRNHSQAAMAEYYASKSGIGGNPGSDMITRLLQILRDAGFAGGGSNSAIAALLNGLGAGGGRGSGRGRGRGGSGGGGGGNGGGGNGFGFDENT